MTNEEIKVLTGALADLAAIQSQPRPYGRGQGWAATKWIDAQNGLVKARPGWVGWDGLPHERKRFTRLLERMHQAGLIVRAGFEGGCLTHVRVTDEGRSAIADMEVPTDD